MSYYILYELSCIKYIKAGAYVTIKMNAKTNLEENAYALPKIRALRQLQKLAENEGIKNTYIQSAYANFVYEKLDAGTNNLTAVSEIADFSHLHEEAIKWAKIWATPDSFHEGINKNSDEPTKELANACLNKELVNCICGKHMQQLEVSNL